MKTFAIFFGVRCTWSSVNVGGNMSPCPSVLVRVTYIPTDCTDKH